MTITGQSTLNKDDIDRMVKDAEAHAEEDRQRREEAEVRNNADSLVYQTEKLLKDNADKIDEADKSLIQTPLDQLKTALNGNDIAAIKTAHEALGAAAQQFSQKLYEKASAEQAAGTSASGAAGGTGSDDDIIDAEIVDES
jgi:molecular chaperone DnaK